MLSFEQHMNYCHDKLQTIPKFKVFGGDICKVVFKLNRKGNTYRGAHQLTKHIHDDKIDYVFTPEGQTVFTPSGTGLHLFASPLNYDINRS